MGTTQHLHYPHKEQCCAIGPCCFVSCRKKCGLWVQQDEDWNSLRSKGLVGDERVCGYLLRHVGMLLASTMAHARTKRSPWGHLSIGGGCWLHRIVSIEVSGYSWPISGCTKMILKFCTRRTQCATASTPNAVRVPVYAFVGGALCHCAS